MCEWGWVYFGWVGVSDYFLWIGGGKWGQVDIFGGWVGIYFEWVRGGQTLFEWVDVGGGSWRYIFGVCGVGGHFLWVDGGGWTFFMGVWG